MTRWTDKREPGFSLANRRGRGPIHVNMIQGGCGQEQPGSIM